LKQGKAQALNHARGTAKLYSGGSDETRLYYQVWSQIPHTQLKMANNSNYAD